MKVHIDRIENSDTKDYGNQKLPKCPICGKKAFIHRDIVDGFYFGWSVGCPAYCNNDGVHGHDENTPDELRLRRFYLDSKEECERWWVSRCAMEGNNG